MLVRPEFSGRSQSGLNFIDQQSCAILRKRQPSLYVISLAVMFSHLFRQLLQLLEECGTAMVITTFALNRFNDDADHGMLFGTVLME
jgi:hypothetical protein